MEDFSDTLSEDTQSIDVSDSQKVHIAEYICAERRIFDPEDLDDRDEHIQYHVHWEGWELGSWDTNQLGDLQVDEIERSDHPCKIAKHEMKTQYGNHPVQPSYDTNNLLDLALILSKQLGVNARTILGILAAVPQDLIVHLIGGAETDSLQHYYENNNQIERTPVIYMIEFVHVQTGLAPTIEELRQCLSEEVKPPNLNVQHRLDCMEEHLDKLYELDWDPAAVCPLPPRRYIGVAYDWKRRQAQHSSGKSSNAVLKHMSRVPALRDIYKQKFSIIFPIYASDQLRVGEQVFHALCPMTCNISRPGGSTHRNEALLDRSDIPWRQRELAVLNGPFFKANMVKIQNTERSEIIANEKELEEMIAADAEKTEDLHLLTLARKAAQGETIVEELQKLQKDCEKLSIS